MNKKTRTSELYENIPQLLLPLFEKGEYPWQIIPHIKDYIISILKAPPADYTLISSGIIIGKEVVIHDSVRIEAPAVIGHQCELRHGAYIRGSVIIGNRCVIGNSSELKNCILLDKVQAPHYNYIGDSILGYSSHLGAGAVCSNLRSDKSDVIIHGDTEYHTGLRKVGAFIGDHCEIGCGSVLCPGCVIGRASSAYPLTLLRGVYPENSIIKGTNEITSII